MKAALVGFLLACLALTPAVSAGSLTAASPPYDRVLTIPLNDWEAFFVEVPAGGGIIVTVDLMSVGSIDIYVTDRGGFTNYSDPGATEFLYNVGWTAGGGGGYKQTPPADRRGAPWGLACAGTDLAPGTAASAPGTVSPSVLVRAQQVNASGRCGAVDDVAALFTPRSIAVVGASRQPGKIGYVLVHNLIVGEDRGTIYPVTPNPTSVHGIRAYPNVAAIPDPVDLAVICVPAEPVPAIAEECG